MRLLLAAALLCLFTATQASAADAPPSEQSLRRLLEATDSKNILDNTLASVDASMDAAIKSSLAGRPLDEKTQQIVDDMRRKLSDVMKETLAWKDMEPLFIQVYQRSLTQDEVNGMLAFYESEAGRAVTRKMPLIMQNTMQLMQVRMQALMPKIAQIQREAVAQLQATDGK